ncbi:unnamed protein product, partial [Pylaiella littoralis]
QEEEVKVGLQEADLGALAREFDEEVVKKSVIAWNIIIEKMMYRPILTLMMACGSPQAAWRIFLKFYEEKKEHERSRLEDEFRDVEMLSGESSQSYLVRAEAIRQRLVELDRNSDTTHDYKHIVRGLLSPTYDIEKRILAGRQVLNLSEIEYVMNQADRDLRSAARKRERDDAAHALVMAGTGWHGGGRGQPWHGRGAGRGGQLE